MLVVLSLALVVLIYTISVLDRVLGPEARVFAGITGRCWTTLGGARSVRRSAARTRPEWTDTSGSAAVVTRSRPPTSRCTTGSSCAKSSARRCSADDDESRRQKNEKTDRAIDALRQSKSCQPLQLQEQVVRQIRNKSK